MKASQMATSSGVVLLCSFWCQSSIQVPRFSPMLLRCMMFRISSRTACDRICQLSVGAKDPQPQSSLCCQSCILGAVLWEQCLQAGPRSARQRLRPSEVWHR